MLGAGGLVQGIGDADQLAVSVIGVLGTLLRAVDLGGDLTQGVPLALVGRTHRIGDGGRVVGQVGIAVGEGGGDFRPGNLQRMAEAVACDLPSLIVGAFDTDWLTKVIALNGPVGAVRAGLGNHLAVVIPLDQCLVT